MKILIVEDEDLIRKTLQRSLTSRGHEVESEPDGEKGLLREQSFKPDLVLLDLMMPIKNGFDFMKETESRSPIIIMTAYSGDHLEKFSSDEFPLVIGLLKKPFVDLQDLLLQIESLYANHFRKI